MTQHSTDLNEPIDDQHQPELAPAAHAQDQAGIPNASLIPPGSGDHPDPGASRTVHSRYINPPEEAPKGPLPRVVSDALGLEKITKSPGESIAKDDPENRTSCPVQTAPSKPKPAPLRVQTLLNRLKASSTESVSSEPQLPAFQRPGKLSNARDATLLRKPRAPGERANRRSRANIEADRVSEAELKQALLPSAEQIPQPGPDPLAFWESIKTTYREDPVGFTEDVLSVVPDEWQAEAMQAIARGERRLSVRAGHGVGKSAFCAWLIIWQMVVRFPQRTVITAPTQGQLFDALFAEVKLWFRKLDPVILNLFEIKSERIEYRANPEASYVSARTSSKERSEALAGIHCEDGWVLLVADEASAIPEKVFESATGSMSGERASTILIGNPTRNSGLFYETHHKLSDKADKPVSAPWLTMHVSCLDSPRAAKSDFSQQIADTYGIRSNAYQTRVLGEFAEREDDVLIPAYLIEAATKRDIVIDPKAPLIYGVDVSRFGDDRSVICKRRGNVVLETKWWAKVDLMETVAIIAREARLDNPDEICVDSIGLGAGVADRLREMGFNVRDVNVAEAASMNPSGSRLRDDLWIQTRDWFQTLSVCIPSEDERLISDLKAPTYSFSSTNKLVVEPKALMKKRGLASPDHADALCLTFAGQAALIGGRSPLWSSSGKGPLRRNLSGVV